MILEFDKKKFKESFNIEAVPSINRVCQSNNIISGSICFNLKPDAHFYKELSKYHDLIVFVPKDGNAELSTDLNPSILVIQVINPRFSYVYACINCIQLRLKQLAKNPSDYYADSSFIEESAVLMPGVYIGPGCSIGKNVYLAPGVKLIENVSIGDNTVIGANTVVGQWGFGIERNNGKPRTLYPHGGDAYKMPHFGGVVIGSDCDIGALNTIAAGAIEPTILGDNVQTDDHVHIGHNCNIDRSVLITACSEISGSVRIEEEAWLGPNCSIMQKIVIGKESVVGIGSVVRKSIPENSVVFGNPSKKLK